LHADTIAARQLQMLEMCIFANALNMSMLQGAPCNAGTFFAPIVVNVNSLRRGTDESQVTTMRTKAEKMVTPPQAARILDVHVNTVNSWIAAGRLPAVKRKVVEYKTFIPASALEEAFEVTCLLCGDKFQARRPQQAKFCCQKHRDEWHLQRRRKKK